MAVTASEDPAEAADRLEQALERIAALSAERTHMVSAGRMDVAAHQPATESALPSGADTAELAARLDALIARVRSALESPAS